MALNLGMASSPTAFTLAPVTRLRPSAPPLTRSYGLPQGDVSHKQSERTYALAVGGGATLGLGGALLKASLRRRVATQAAFDPSGEVGVLMPLDYWDPCGLMKEREGMTGWRWKDEETFEFYRTAELKHGRLAMIALTGMLAAGLTKFPQFKQLDVDGWAVADTPAASGLGIIAIIAGYLEFTTPKGDYKDPWGVGEYEGWGYTRDVKEKELAHGRLAMSAVVSLWLYEYGADMQPSDMLGNISGYFVALFGGLLLIWTNPQESWPKGKDITKLYAGDTVASLPAPTEISIKAEAKAPKTSPAASTDKVEEKVEDKL
jgi:hypothetical protein